MGSHVPPPPHTHTNVDSSLCVETGVRNLVDDDFIWGFTVVMKQWLNTEGLYQVTTSVITASCRGS